ncbi:protease modulator HflK, partial [Planctomycetota bacterium]
VFVFICFDVHIPVDQMDPAARSLSEALGVSFVILKVIMVIVILAFLGSGLKIIGPGEQAVVLRFGKLCDINDVQGGNPYVRGEGLLWTLPYPIDEVIRIPVREKVPFEIRSFWYFQTPDEILGTRPTRMGPTLDPLRDGYTLVRGEGLPSLTGAHDTEEFAEGGSDYNLMHSKWQVVYEISDISRFFKNVLVADPKPGEVYFDLIKKSVTPIIQNVVEDAVVDVMVRYSIDEAMESDSSIPLNVKRQAQDKLNLLETGIRLTSVTVNDRQPPRQVQVAFDALQTARQERETLVKEAQTYKNTMLNESAGAVAEDLARALQNPDVPPDELERLWSLAKGEVSGILTQAETYRSQVVEEAKARAQYFQSLLVQYREQPQLVRDKLYLEMIAEVLSLADEKIVLQPGQGKDREIRIQINRDASLKTGGASDKAAN